MADPIEQFLSRLHHPALASIDLKLDRMNRLLSMMGNPQLRLPPVIHVAGTNGKGSAIAYLRAIFEAAGLKVHVYTSPHLVQFRERIVLAGKMIENAQIESLIRHAGPILAAQPATFFEATTALAFLAFAQSKADILLLEVGMGGRLDATNVIARPLATIITPVSLDHTEFLGDTIEKIAAEKAGILKKNVPCIVGRQSPEALGIIEQKANELNAPLFRLGHEWRVAEKNYISANLTLELTPALLGEHQYDNAATAIAAIEQLPQFNITQAQMQQGIASATWPARIQRLQEGPYLSIHPELWLDGGHNEQGAEIFANWASAQNRPVYAVCGMVGTKDALAYMKKLAPVVKELHAVQIPTEPTSKTAQEVAAAAASAGIAAHTAASVEQALQAIKKNVPESGLVAIVGSLYLAGFVLQNHR